MPIYKFPPLTGGFSINPAQPNECYYFDNIDINRNRYPETRNGSYLMHTTAALGTGMCVGIGRTVCPINSAPKAIIAKTGTTFYYCSTDSTGNFILPLSSIPIPFSSFTVPATPLGDPVYFVTMLDASFVPQVYMSNINWDHVVTWDGSGPASAYVVASPANPKLLAVFNKQLFVVRHSEPNILYFSDIGDPATWPGTNKFQVEAQYGQIVALLPQDDRLYIFTTSGILYMIGDPTDPYVGVLHPYITCVNQGCVSQYGASSVFMGRDNNFYTLTGTVDLLSDSLRGRPFGAISETLSSTLNAWGALTPFYYVVRAPIGTSSTAATAGANNSFMLVKERTRFGYWGRYTYPTTSGIGASNPWQAVVFYMPEWQALIVPAGNGDVYLQPLMDSTYPAGVAETPRVDVSNTVQRLWPPVTSIIQTNLVMMNNNDPSITNRFIEGMVYGAGHNVNVTVNLLGLDVRLQPYKLPITRNIGRAYRTDGFPGKAIILKGLIQSSTTMPLQFTVLNDGSDQMPDTEFSMFQLTLTGQDLLLVGGPDIEYSPQRRDFLNYA